MATPNKMIISKMTVTTVAPAELWHYGLPSVEVIKAGYLPDRCIITSTDHVVQKSTDYFYLDNDNKRLLNGMNQVAGVVVYISKPTVRAATS